MVATIQYFKIADISITRTYSASIRATSIDALSIRST